MRAFFDRTDRDAVTHLGSASRPGRTAGLPKRASRLVRSDPAGTAEVMYRMVTDGATKTVHYYSGPDDEAIPRGKQLLGQDWYFEELSARNRGEATGLWDALMPNPIEATE